MTDDRMALIELVEKAADIDLVREMLALAAERIMDAEVETLTGAAKGARSALRETHRNGYRERDSDTQAGRITLAIPKLRKGSWLARMVAALVRSAKRSSWHSLIVTWTPPAAASTGAG